MAKNLPHCKVIKTNKKNQAMIVPQGSKC